MTSQTINNAAAMPTAPVLNTVLVKAGRRIRVRTLLRYCGRGLCWSAVPAALCVGFSKLHWYATPSPAVPGTVIGLASAAAIVLALTRPLKRLEIAKITERRTDLKERLSSAVEFHSESAHAGERFYSEQLSDAETHAASINLRTTFPMRIPWELPVGVLCTLLVFLTYFLPTLPVFWTQAQKDEVAAVKKQGIQIEKVAKDTEKAADQQKLNETKKAAAEAKKLGEQMRKGKMTKKESLVALAKLTKKMEETQQRLAQPPAKKSLDSAHKDFQKALDKLSKEKEDEAKKAEMAKSDPKTGKPQDMKKPGEKLENRPKESEQMREMKQAMQQMSTALANQDASQMQQAMQKMAQQMQKGGMSKEEMQQTQQALQQLAQSLKETSQQAASEQMQQLSEMMQASNMDPNSMQQMAAMMNAIGKEMGKGEMAGQSMDAKTLAELMQALKDGRLTLGMGGKDGIPMAFRMHAPGKGFGGLGAPADAMKDPGNTKARLTAMGKNNAAAGKGKAGSAAEFAKYLAMTAKGGSQHQSNGKINGTRSALGNELQMSMTGDPSAARSSSPYYQVVQSSKKQAESTLSKENIPASLKKQVKDYFDSIKP